MGSASDTTVHLRFPFDNKDGALEPGKALLVGTGIEDYFNSGFAFGFFGKTFHNDLSGLSHVHGSTGHGMKAPRPGWFSAYRCVSREQLQLQLTARRSVLSHVGRVIDMGVGHACSGGPSNEISIIGPHNPRLP